METELKVTALMTAPRHEIVLARNYIEIALRKAGVPLVVSGGVFYGQCMQRMLSEAVESGADVAITVDFDSMFTAQDVHRLLQCLIESDDADAVAALQCRRGKRFPLLTTGGPGGEIQITGQPFKVATAHFGLTAIDLHKLAKTAKPWFFSQPDENGEWGDDKIDDDIWFWQQWREAGNTIYIDPNTRIGHMEEMVTYFDDDMQPQHIYPIDWGKANYPAVEKRGTLVYVGANVGGPGVEKLVNIHERSYLFEPQKTEFWRLREAFDSNPGVTIIRAACALESKREVELNVYNDGKSSSLGVVTDQAKLEYIDANLDCMGQEYVDTVNLLDWLADHTINEIRTLIIDAQGMDLTILKTLTPLLEQGAIESIQCEADGPGFTHYTNVPDNSETGFLEFMERFPHYTPSRQPHRRECQPDLTWTLNKEALCRLPELCS